MSTPAILQHAPRDLAAIQASGMIAMLTEGGAAITLQADKTLKGKFVLRVDEVRTEFTFEEALDSNGEMKPDFIEKLRDWLYAYVPRG